MKTAVIYRNTPAVRFGLRYPNSATPRQILQKIVDLLLVGAICLGCSATILFLAVLA